MRRILAASLVVLIASCSPSATAELPTSVIATSPSISQETVTIAAPAATTASPASATPKPTDLRWQPVVDGLSQPVALAHTDDDRLFVVEKAGAIRIIQGGALAADPFLDIRARVGSRDSEQGLLGLAFHPRYRQNGFFFVDYTDVHGNTVIARYHADPGSMTADPNSEHVILRVQQPYPNHNGGQLAFGPDGKFYIGLGDGGSQGDPNGNGQSLNTLLAKLLRIDVDAADPYGIPADNPFAHGGGRPEIWAYGLRNPWRFTFDRLTGDLYIADVGQDAWEEIDFQPAGAPGGANYGWNLREGLHAYTSDSTAGLIDPVAEYGHDQGCAVIGGAVIRAPSLPAWQGTYVFGDYCSGRVWGLTNAGGNWQTRRLFDTPYHITSFGEDQAGEIYLADYGGKLLHLQLVSQP
jgi:glucose/arabinose dehydrogenase